MSFSQKELRAELLKLMPGYSWTVNSSLCRNGYFVATGIQTSGTNRLSTLHVERRDNYAASGLPRYEVRSAGYGARSPWLHSAADSSLSRALRDLQNHYEREASKFSSHASALRAGRSARVQEGL